MLLDGTSPFQVIPVEPEFTFDNFLDLVVSLPLQFTDSRHLSSKEKNIVRSIYKLIEKDLRSIVVEHIYIDRDYIEDYAGFFSRSFKDYYSKCSRLHFSSLSLDEQGYRELFQFADSREEFKASYLGFMVLKPLPKSIVGKTCLNTIEAKAPSNTIVLSTNYAVNLNGIDLSVNGVAFQEQDKATSACSTNAIWTLFQLSSQLYQHPIRSPHAITKTATEQVYSELTRSFPNKGLSVTQMLAAIRDVGIDYDVHKVNRDDDFFKGIIYSYIKNNIPCLIASAVTHKKNKVFPTMNRKIGAHAVTVLGCKFGSNKIRRYKKSGMLSPVSLTSSRVSGFIIHDDGVGPYCNYEFSKGALQVSNSDNFLLPEYVITPLYHKVRVAYDTVLDLTSKIEVIFNRLIYENIKEHIGKIFDYEWDLFLTNSNTYKSSLVGSNLLSGSESFSALHKPMPKYVWQATLLAAKGEKVLDIIFDATDFQHEDMICHVTTYDNTLGIMSKILFLELSLDGEELERTPYKSHVQNLSFVLNNIKNHITEDDLDD